jgi:2-polyprenyl-3-methyl-5-hydroxy-6-metoxy-1,4-benzoquinol methylase
MRERFSDNEKIEIALMDMDNPRELSQTFDIVHCYGLLYHLSRPEQALQFLARHCKGILLLETCVSFGSDPKINPVKEQAHNHSQSFYGQGCRPTRPWIFNILSQLFEYVYTTSSQPAHEESPLDWTIQDSNPKQLKRSVFVASRQPLQSPYLANELVLKHITG